MITLILFSGFIKIFGRYITWVMILHGIEYQRPTSLNMRILADHVTYSFLAFMKSIFHFCLGCYCGGYSQNKRSNLSSSNYIKFIGKGYEYGIEKCKVLSMRCNVWEMKMIGSYVYKDKKNHNNATWKDWHWTWYYLLHTYVCHYSIPSNI